PSSSDDGESDPQHSLSMVFLLVLVFFIMGLVGFLICHVLKKKGYRCRTFRDELDPDNKDVLEELNEDTVEKIVRCIIQNEANAEALKEMLGDNEGDIPLPVPSQDGGPPHHHTVHLGSTQAPCIHCSKRKRHPLHRQGRSKDGKGRMHPGETTVFSVGRYWNEPCSDGATFGFLWAGCCQLSLVSGLVVGKPDLCTAACSRLIFPGWSPAPSAPLCPSPMFFSVSSHSALCAWRRWSPPKRAFPHIPIFFPYPC
uniref:RELT like 2 n=1 Tax=Anas platyrhynchos TaxID=8839 RepID=A0A8B9T4Y5_ANAPL